MSIKIKLNNDWVDTNIQAVRGVNHVNSEDVYTKQESDALFSGKVNKTDIVQSTGTSTTAVMSQKAVSDIVGELESQVIYDVTTNNSGTTFDSLSALLSNENLSTLIPSEVRCGGMSIRFVQSSDNKYVQYRLMANEFTTDVTKWQGVDDEPTVGSDNIVKSGGVLNSIESKCLYANIREIFSISGYIDMAGVFHEATSIACTDYIDISTFSGVEYSLYAGYGTVVALYDSSKVFVGYIDCVNQSINNRFAAFSQFENAKYIRFSCKKDYIDKAAIRFIISNDFADFVYSNQWNILELKIDKIFTLSGFIGEDGQENPWDGSSFVYTDYIDISKFAGVECCVSTGNGTAQALYNSNKQFLGIITCVDQSINNRFVDFSQFEGAKYIRFTCKKDYLEQAAIRFIVSKEIAKELSKDCNFNNFGYYDANGNFSTSKLTRLTGYIDISDKYAVTVTARGSFSAVSLFDENKQFVESILTLSGEAVYNQAIYLGQYKNRGKYIRVSSNSERNSPAFNDYNVTLIYSKEKDINDVLNRLNPDTTELSYLSAHKYGAVGDGVADDTEAMEQLFADAYSQKKAVYIPSGTYLIRRSLTLRTGMEIFGNGINSVITKPASVWTQITQDIVENDEVVHVTSTNGLHIGDQFYITHTSDVTGAAARHCTVGVIMAIDSANNTVTFKSSYDSIKVGAVRSQTAGCYLSTGFGLLRSWGMHYECNDVYIHDLKLDGNRTNGEPMEWFNGLIHFDAYGGTIEGIPYNYHSHDHTIKNCTLINGSFDAVSEQGEYNTFVENCIIKNCAMHGIHFGTTFENGRVIGCAMQGNGIRGAAIFWCANVKKLMVSDNYIKGFNRGCSDEEYGGIGVQGVITNNIFENIIESIINFPTATLGNIGGDFIISNNMIIGLNNELFDGKYQKRIVITNNVISSVTGTNITIIKATNSDKVIIVGNICAESNNITVDIDTTGSTNVVNVNNLMQQ